MTVQTYQNGATGGNTEYLRINLINKGATAIGLNTAKIRCYLPDGGYAGWNAALDYSVLGTANNTPSAWVDMYEKYQNLALQSRLHIPMIWGTDAAHGDNSVYGATIFPHNAGLDATRDPALVHKRGKDNSDGNARDRNKLGFRSLRCRSARRKMG